MKERQKYIKVYGTDEVLEGIKAEAAAANLSHSEYIRRVVTGLKIKQVSDVHLMKTIAELNRSVARYGNLLKLWLNNDKKVIWFGREHLETVIQNNADTHQRIKKTMDLLASSFR